MTKWIVSSYALLVDIALWVIVIAGATIGYNFGNIIGLIFGAILTFFMSAIFLGGFLILNEVRRSIRNIEQQLNGS